MYKIIKYGAPWCTPCRSMEDLFARAKNEYPEIIFESVDISQSKNACFLEDYKIISIPITICFKNDKVVSKNVGALSYTLLQELIKNLINGK